MKCKATDNHVKHIILKWQLCRATLSETDFAENALNRGIAFAQFYRMVKVSKPTTVPHIHV